MTHQLTVAMATRMGAGQPNQDVAGLHGWVLYAQHNWLSVNLPVDSLGPTRVALTTGRDIGDGRRDARIAAELLSLPDGSGSIAAPEARDAFHRAHDAIRRRRVPGRAGGCAAALLTVGVDGSATVGAVGGVHVFRMVEGYAGQLTRGAGPGRLGGAGPVQLDTPYEFSALPGDRLIMCTHDLSDADLTGSAGTDGLYLAHRLAFGEGSRRDTLTVLVVDVARARPAGRDAHRVALQALADRPALEPLRPSSTQTEPEHLPDVVR
jgi:hypothetical protein